MQIHQPIDTPRLRIRDYRTADLSFVLSIWLDPVSGRYMSDPSAEAVDEAYIKALGEMEDNPDGYYFIIETSEGTPVGTCCAFPSPDRRTFDIGYAIARENWRKGYAEESLRALIAWLTQRGAFSVTAEVADENEASLALLAKLGFVFDRMSAFTKWNTGIKFPSSVRRLTIKVPEAPVEADDFPVL